MKKVVVEFEEKLSTKVRKQEKLDIVEEEDFKREKLLKKSIWWRYYYKWDDGKFEEEYLEKLESYQSCKQ